MIISIPRVVKELKENATEEQRCGLNILERRFYECISLSKKLDIAVKALEEIKSRLEGEDDWLIVARALREIEEEQ